MNKLQLLQKVALLSIMMVTKRYQYFQHQREILSATEIFKLCFGEVDERHICAEKPISVRKNAVFVINLNDIDIRSLYADDNGVWNVATPRKYFRVEIKYGKIAEVLPGHKVNYTHLLK